MSNEVVTQAMTGLSTLIGESEQYDKFKHDHTVSASALRWANSGKMTLIEAEDTLFGKHSKKLIGLNFTDHAFSQLLGRFSPQFFGEGTNRNMRREDWRVLEERWPKAFASVMNDLANLYSDRNASRTSGVLIRAFKHEVRGFLSDKYGIVDNTVLLKSLREILEPEAANLPDMRLVRSVVTADELNVQVVWRNVKGQHPEVNRPGDGFGMGAANTYGIGCAITNGEIGNRGIAVAPIIWRHACTNSIRIQTDQAINLRHIGNPLALMAKVRIGMVDALPFAANALERVYAAEIKQLPSVAAVLRGFAQEYGWDDAFTDAALIGTEGQSTVMAVVNGISYAAHAATKTLDAQIEGAELAGRILVAPDSLFARAAELGRETVTVNSARRR